MSPAWLVDQAPGIYFMGFSFPTGAKVHLTVGPRAHMLGFRRNVQFQAHSLPATG